MLSEFTIIVTFKDGSNDTYCNIAAFMEQSGVEEIDFMDDNSSIHDKNWVKWSPFYINEKLFWKVTE